MEPEFNNRRDIIRNVDETNDRIVQYSFTLMCILAMASDIFLLYIIKKFNRLKSKIPYTYIFHAALIHALQMLLNILLIYIYVDGPFGRYYLLFFSVDLWGTLMLGQIAFLIWMTVDWVLATYHPDKSIILRRHNITTIITVYLYIACSLAFTVTNVFGFGHPSVLPVLAMILVYGIFLISITVIGIVYLCRRKTHPSETFALKVAGFNVFIWFVVALIFLILYKFLGLEFFDIISFHIALFGSIMQIFLFYMWDTNYRACVSKFLCCNKIASNFEDMEQLEDSLSEQPVRYHVNSVGVLCTIPDKCLVTCTTENQVS